jgi:CDP-glucose 4,6-dehydratase
VLVRHPGKFGLEVVAELDPAFWRQKRVLVTGHTGFKGVWLTLYLKRLGATVTGLSLPPHTEPSLFRLLNGETLCENHFCDVRNSQEVLAVVRSSRPELIFHLAAQPLVRASYADPIGTYATNVMGTAHLLDAIRQVNSVRSAVFITTDKVYAQNELLQPFRETDVLGGHDPYSSSKAASELLIDSYRKSFLTDQGVAVASARAGNVIGGGDWSLDRLIPDAIRAWQANLALEIRRPDAIRPWQHVLDPISGYLNLAQKLWGNHALSGAYNFGPRSSEASSVRQVIESAKAFYGHGSIAFANDLVGPHESFYLTLEVTKAKQQLGVNPRWSLEETIRRTIQWYSKQYAGEDAYQLCLSDLEAFEAAV